MKDRETKEHIPRPEAFSHCLHYLYREAANAGMEVPALIIRIAAEAVAALNKDNSTFALDKPRQEGPVPVDGRVGLIGKTSRSKGSKSSGQPD